MLLWFQLPHDFSHAHAFCKGLRQEQTSSSRTERKPLHFRLDFEIPWAASTVHTTSLSASPDCGSVFLWLQLHDIQGGANCQVRAFGRYSSACCTSRDIAWQHKALHDEADNQCKSKAGKFSVVHSQCAESRSSMQAILVRTLISSFPWFSKVHTYYWLAAYQVGKIPFTDVHCINPRLQVHITPLLVLNPYRTSAAHFCRSEFPGITFSLTGNSPVSTVILAQNFKLRFFLNHVFLSEAKLLSSFKDRLETSELSIPSAVPPWILQYLTSFQPNYSSIP